MYEPHVAEVLSRIRPDDVVLDVGGWARPFNRANYVIDCHPYETRGRHYLETFGLAAQGGPAERFTAETYLRLDLCDHTPWPLPDKSIDFCTCSHTLEDLRDPIWVCREMMRVARRGYIETPSRLFEVCRNREAGVPVGLAHHRWYVDIEGNQVVFSPKNHYIHGDPCLSIPESVWKGLPEEHMITWLFWEDTFDCKEGWLTRDDLAAFAREHTGFEAGNRLSEEDQVRFIIWEHRQQLTALQQRLAIAEESASLEADHFRRLIWEHREEIASLRREIESLSARVQEQDMELRAFVDLGAAEIDVARRLRTIARRYPRLASVLKRATRIPA